MLARRNENGGEESSDERTEDGKTKKTYPLRDYGYGERERREKEENAVRRAVVGVVAMVVVVVVVVVVVREKKTELS